MTRFIYTQTCENFEALNSDIEAYLCVLLKKNKEQGRCELFVCIHNEYGVNLKKNSIFS